MSRRRARTATAKGRAAPSISPPPPAPPAPRWLIAIIAVALVAGIGVVYEQTRHFDFVHLDDPAYVSDNPHVTAGLTADGIAWAFTTGHAANWHPVTWISHMVDVELWGLDAGRHHLTSVLLHMVNAVLLFLLIRRLTGALGPSAFVAAIFAVHPMHVESVAWIAERKDVLSACFWIVTIGAYAWYVERPAASRFIVVIVLFGLGLMAKPMVVTLPFVLLLLDWWPLGRAIGAPVGATHSVPRRLSWVALIREKIPLLVLAAVSSVVTVIAQQRGGAVSTLEQVPFADRIGNAIVSYVAYIGKLVWPVNLTMFYPRPATMTVAAIAGIALALALVSWWALRSARRRPYLTVGWFWYLGVLVPVIGLIQVGVQGMADRYAYLPAIGLWIAVAFGAAELTTHRRQWRFAAMGLAAAAVVALAVVAHRQTQYWKNNVTLFARASQITLGQTPAQAHRSLGATLLTERRFDEAIAHFQELARLEPGSAESHVMLGSALAQAGRLPEAIDALTRAVGLAPGSDSTHLALGLALARHGRSAEALRELTETLRLNPSSTEARKAIEALTRGR